VAVSYLEGTASHGECQALKPETMDRPASGALFFRLSEFPMYLDQYIGTSSGKTAQRDVDDPGEGFGPAFFLLLFLWGERKRRRYTQTENDE